VILTGEKETILQLRDSDLRQKRGERLCNRKIDEVREGGRTTRRASQCTVYHIVTLLAQRALMNIWRRHTRLQRLEEAIEQHFVCDVVGGRLTLLSDAMSLERQVLLWMEVFLSQRTRNMNPCQQETIW